MLESLIGQLRTLMPDVVRVTRRLVLINSYSAHVAGLNEVGGVLRELFQLSGLEHRLHPGGSGCGDHHVWSSTASAQAAPILLIGHHDTVFPPGYFEGWHEDRGARVRAPGVYDMKGALAIIWGVLKVLSAAGLLQRLPVVLCSVADEEVGSLDSKPHLEALARGAACALVFESGRVNDAIVTRRRGVGQLRAVASGRAAHAGNAHDRGRNAIWGLSRFVDFAQTLTDYSRGITVNVGMFHGGTSPNTVPAHAEAQLDLRFERVSDAERLLEQLREGIRSASVEGVSLALDGGIKRQPMERSAASFALYKEYAECQRHAGLGSDEHPIVGGGSDANTVAAVGLPAIDGLGPRGGEFHTPREYVELDSFFPKAEALLRFMYGRVPREPSA